jgi:hypothetical protein
MIAFDLRCSRGHIFEGWFDNIESFEEQNSKDMISCPYCGDMNLTRVLSPVAVKTVSGPTMEQGGDNPPLDYKRLAKQMIDYINKEFDDLGPNFTKEALKIHYGVAEERNIRGTATESEEDLLREEGVQFFKLPYPVKDDRKKN